MIEDRVGMTDGSVERSCCLRAGRVLLKARTDAAPHRLSISRIWFLRCQMCQRLRKLTSSPPGSPKCPTPSLRPPTSDSNLVLRVAHQPTLDMKTPPERSKHSRPSGADRACLRWAAPVPTSHGEGQPPERTEDQRARATRDYAGLRSSLVGGSWECCPYTCGILIVRGIWVSYSILHGHFVSSISRTTFASHISW